MPTKECFTDGCYKTFEPRDENQVFCLRCEGLMEGIKDHEGSIDDPEEEETQLDRIEFAVSQLHQMLLSMERKVQELSKGREGS